MIHILGSKNDNTDEDKSTSTEELFEIGKDAGKDDAEKEQDA